LDLGAQPRGCVEGEIAPPLGQSIEPIGSMDFVKCQPGTRGSPFGFHFGFHFILLESWFLFSPIISYRPIFKKLKALFSTYYE
jgi:hypothetical protein